MHPKKFKALNNSGLPYTYSACYLAEGLERRDVNAKVATVLCSISASFDTVESEGRQMKQRWITCAFCVVPLGWLCEDAQLLFTLLYDELGFTLKPEHPLSVYAEFHSFQSLRMQSFTLRPQIRTLFWLCEHPALQGLSCYTSSIQSNNLSEHAPDSASQQICITVFRVPLCLFSWQQSFI